MLLELRCLLALLLEVGMHDKLLEICRVLGMNLLLMLEVFADVLDRKCQRILLRCCRDDTN